MFSKLLKYEFRSQGKLFFGLSLGALGAGAIGGAMMAVLLNTAEKTQGEFNEVLGMLTAMMLLFTMILTIVAYVYTVMILLCYRFYKHHFSDEGYLTFTLPATGHQILLSSFVNYLIWMVISCLVVFAAVLLILVPVFHYVSKLTGVSLLMGFEEAFKSLSQVYDTSLWMYLLSLIFSWIGSAIIPLASITIGSVVAKKHKVLASVGIYFGIQMALSVLSGILSIATTVGDILIAENTGTMSLNLTMLIPSLLYLALGIGGYFLMHHLVSKKLNLP